MAGNLDKEYQSYLEDQEYAQYQKASAQAQNPPQIPDAADKVAQGNKPNAQPTFMSRSIDAGRKFLGEAPMDWSGKLAIGEQANQAQDQYKQQHANDSNLDKLKRVFMGDPNAPMQPVAGNPPLALPGSALPAGLTALGTFLGNNAPLRVGTSGVMGGIRGAINSPEDRLGGAMKGVGKGLLYGTGAELLGGAINAVGQGARTIKTAMNPAETQDAAQEAVDATSQALKSSEAENLQTQLGPHKLEINLKDYQGLSPETDALLSKHTPSQSSLYGEASPTITLPAVEAQKLKVMLDQASRTATGNGVVNPALAQRANTLRDQLHDLSPEIDETYQHWAENLQGAKSFDRTNSPIAFLSGKGADRQAVIQKAGEATGSNLEDVAKQLQLAKPVMEHPASIKGLMAIPKSGVYGAKQSLFGNPNTTAVDPRDLQGLSQLFQNK